MPVRLLVVDRDRLLRWSLRSFVEHLHDVDIVAEADCARAALLEGAHQRPDVALVDLDMPGCGLSGLRQLCLALGSCRVLAHGHDHDRAFVRSVLECGCLGYVVRSGRLDELCLAIQQVARGEQYLSPAARPEPWVLSDDDRAKFLR